MGIRPDKALERIAKSKKPVGLLLMEQEVMAGIGNIFRAELLFRARAESVCGGAGGAGGGGEDDVEGCGGVDAGGDGR